MKNIMRNLKQIRVLFGSLFVRNKPICKYDRRIGKLAGNKEAFGGLSCRRLSGFLSITFRNNCESKAYFQYEFHTKNKYAKKFTPLM